MLTLNFHNALAVATVLITFFLTGTYAQAPSYPFEYCSSLNTASNGNGNYSMYQSMGLCHDFCLSSHAFAVLQGSDCWCSDYVPGVLNPTSDCSQSCPGYKTDLCGGTNLFGYIPLGKSPAGTVGASSAAAASSTPVAVPPTVTATVASTVAPAVSLQTVTQSANPVTVSANPVTVSVFIPTTPLVASVPTTSSTPITTSSAQSTPNPVAQTTPLPVTIVAATTYIPTPVTSLETVTGQVRTVTVTPSIPTTSTPDPPPATSTTPAAAAAQTSADATPANLSSSSTSALSTGAAVGLTIGIVAAVILLGALAWFLVRKRRQARAASYDSVSVPDSNGPPQRTMSQSSRYMLNSNGKDVVEAWQPVEEEQPNTASRRSRLMPVDPRLDPYASVYQRGEGNRSRESVATIQDNHDYSRRVANSAPVLRATNPD